MAAKHLHFEKAFLPLAQSHAGENVFPVILREADVKPAARGAGLPSVLRLSPPRLKTKRRRTGR